MAELFNNPTGIALAIIFILETFNLVTKVFENAKAWRKPAKTVDDRLTDHDRKLDNDNKRLNSLGEGQTVMIRGIKALLWHERTGNSVDKLADASEAIDNYLTEKK